jgi:long-chain acyl-CoA synthetase
VVYWDDRIVGDVVVEKQFGLDLKVYKKRPLTVIDVFNNAVESFSSKEALVCEDERITYCHLQDMVNRMVVSFDVRCNIMPDDRIAILLDNSIQFCVSVLAAIQSGAIGVPLNARLEAMEIAYMLNHSRAKILITDYTQWAKVKDTIKQLDFLETVFLDAEFVPPGIEAYSSLLSYKAPKQIPFEKNEEDVAIIMYTSGTTGTPKGANITHLNIIHSILSYSRIMRTGNKDKTLVAVPLFHVTGLVAQFLHFISIGGTCVIMRSFKTERFLDLMVNESITHTIAVPTIYFFMLNSPELKYADLSSLRIAAYGGAPMAKDTILRLKAELPWLELYNCYGATETTSPATITPADKSLLKADSVGLPVPVGEMKVCDDQGNELSQGSIGELRIKGPMVIPGYWENPSANEHCFIDGYWLSGDLAKIDEDGFIYIMGRKKDMISRGGEKIYPIEIENILCNHPEVLEAAVYGVPDKIYGEQIKAAIVLKGSRMLSEDDLKTFLAGKIARHKIPFYYLFTDELPRNPGGKVIKSKLI